MKHVVALLVPLERSLQGGVHRLCFVAFGPLVGKLLNFKVFYELENRTKLPLILENL